MRSVETEMSVPFGSFGSQKNDGSVTYCDAFSKKPNSLESIVALFT